MQISNVIGLLFNISTIIMKCGNYIIKYIKNRNIKRKYKDTSQIIENGEIDKINDIFKDHI